MSESTPGFEGKQLAKDLVDLGVSVRLIADSSVNSIISNIDAVLIGADAILADGSVINKIGTNEIARAAYEKGKPVYVICETAKFSAQDFLVEPIDVSNALFDITPSEYVSAIITEEGRFEPRQVKDRIREMLSQLYP